MNPEDFTAHFRATFADVLGRRLVVALSGGADSVALLHLLEDSKLDVSLLAAHVHHGVRGAEADEDAAFCEVLCTRLGVPLTILRLGAEMQTPHGREAAWRQARYALLKSHAKKVRAAAVATAHHRDDIAEGVLVQVLRGAGPRALAGIRQRDEGLIRPLLPWSHGDLCGWLETRGLPWREDSSNQSPEHLRNRVRHEILPFLERTSPALRRHLVRLSSDLACSEHLAASLLLEEAAWIDVWHPEGGVPAATVAALHPALQVRWLHAQAARSGIGRVTRRQGEHFMEVLDDRRRAVTLADRWSLRLASGRLLLEPPSSPRDFSLTLSAGESVDLPLPGWRADFRRRREDEESSPWRRAIEREGDLEIRSPRPNDLLPDGRRLRSLLSSKLPRHLRNSWPIFVIGDKIMWVPGLGIDDGAPNGSWMVEVTRT